MVESVEAAGVAAGAAADRQRPLPPVWLMGFGQVPLGAAGALTLITTPQLLAANHVPEPQIAGVTAIALIPGFAAFLLAPLLDWRYRRRTYAIVCTIIGAACQFAALLSIGNLPLLTALLFTGFMAIALSVAAVGGWFGALVRTEDKAALGVWFTVANIGTGGIVASLAIYLLRGMPYALGAALLCLPILAGLPLFLWVRCPPADRRLASESFRAFVRDVLALLRQASVLWTLPLFLAPSASFALTNTLGGLGRDFNTSERMVGLIGGVGVTVAGVAGSLLIQALATRVKPRPLYLAVGLAGAVFTTSLIFLARSPAVFGLAMLGENVFQAGAFSVGNIIILRTIGHENPLAATQFGLLNASLALPLAYMQAIDGAAYGHGGVNATFLADAGISGAACLLLALMLWTWRRRVPPI
jgi:PAT family beta-lactamase induction signal transducer AmpG